MDRVRNKGTRKMDGLEKGVVEKLLINVLGGVEI